MSGGSWEELGSGAEIGDLVVVTEIECVLLV
jgi:hypothetical protein